MATMYRDPATADRIKALGPSKVNPDVDAAMRGKKGKRPKKVCPECGEPLGPNHKPHDDSDYSAKMMDQGRAR